MSDYESLTADERHRFHKAVPEQIGMVLKNRLAAEPEAPLDLRETFAQFVEKRINEDVHSFMAALDIFANSYHWADGVPDLQSGAKVPIHRSAAYCELFENPRSFHMPIAERVALSRAYMAAVIKHSYGNPEMWARLAQAFPNDKESCELMEAVSLLYAAK